MPNPYGLQIFIYRGYHISTWPRPRKYSALRNTTGLGPTKLEYFSGHFWAAKNSSLALDKHIYQSNSDQSVQPNIKLTDWGECEQTLH